MARILILGATGFIGRNMLKRFASNADYEIHAVSHIKPKHYVERVAWHRVNLRDASSVKYIMKDMDVVIQCAATTSGSKDIVNTPSIHVTDNAIMNSLVFRAAHEAKVKHLIFFSCTTMFSSGVITEDSPLDIHPKYFGVAHTKLYCEKLCQFYAGLGATRFTAIRHSNIYGPHDKYDLERSHVFGATVTKVMTSGGVVNIWGNGEEARDLLHVDDLCDFVECALDKQSSSFEIYNCGSGNAVKVKDLVQKIIEASGRPLRIEYDLSAPTIPISLSLDCTKAKDDLGWSPKIGLDDGIKKTLEWYKSNVVL